MGTSQGLSAATENQDEKHQSPGQAAASPSVLPMAGPPEPMWGSSGPGVGWGRVPKGHQSTPPTPGPQPAPGSSLGFPKSIKTREKLSEYLTVVIFTASAQHAAVNFGQVGKGWAGHG